HPEPWLTMRAPPVPFERRPSRKPFVLLSLLSALYGGFHAGMSWNGYFPSLVEERLWRVAVCAACAGFIIWALLEISLQEPEWLKNIGGRLLGFVGIVFRAFR